MDGEVRRVEVDHADRAAGRRVVDGAQVEVAELIGREEREPPAADGDAGEIVGKVVVRRDPRSRAHPDARKAEAVAHIDMVRLVQPVEEVVNVDGGEIDGRRAGIAFRRVDLREDLGQLRA